MPNRFSIEATLSTIFSKPSPPKSSSSFFSKSSPRESNSCGETILRNAGKRTVSSRASCGFLVPAPYFTHRRPLDDPFVAHVATHLLPLLELILPDTANAPDDLR